MAGDGAPELGQVGGAGRADSVEVASARDQTALEYQDPFLHAASLRTGLVEMPYDPAELYQLDQQGLVH